MSGVRISDGSPQKSHCAVIFGRLCDFFDCSAKIASVFRSERGLFACLFHRFSMIIELHPSERISAVDVKWCNCESYKRFRIWIKEPLCCKAIVFFRVEFQKRIVFHALKMTYPSFMFPSVGTTGLCPQPRRAFALDMRVHLDTDGFTFWRTNNHERRFSAAKNEGGGRTGRPLLPSFLFPSTAQH